MQTDDLIQLLTKDAPVKRRFNHVFVTTIAVSLLVSFVLLLITLGLRQNLLQAAQTPRVAFKIGLAVLLAITGSHLALRIGKPGVPLRPALLALALPAAALVIGVVSELSVVPAAQWEQSLVGRYPAACVFFVSLLSLAPLTGLIYALRQAAPENPAKAGAVAGLASGALAACIYALHCPDDSPLFVATWYTTGIALVTLAGVLLGRRLLRW